MIIAQDKVDLKKKQLLMLYIAMYRIYILKKSIMTFFIVLAIFNQLLYYTNNLFNKLFYIRYNTHEIKIGSGTAVYL